MNWVTLPRVRLPWPTPALAVWTLAWGVFALLRDAAPNASLAAGLTVGAVGAWAWPGSVWRRGLIGLGFPMSLALTGLAAGLPPLAWAAALVALALIYPMQTWRDAPMFPTPADALSGLGAATQLPAGARVLDAGCGLGHGLRALRHALPAQRIEGIERSWPLVGMTALRCRWAHVRQGDMWRQPWQGLQLVYLFQRPESMARAWAKAEAEMAPGAWLASLEFEVPGRQADAVLRRVPGKPVWLYRVNQAAVAGGAQPGAAKADKSPECLPRKAGPQHRG